MTYPRFTRRVEEDLVSALKSLRLKGLNQLRNRAFSQANVAREIGVHPSALYNWENGICYPGSFDQWQAWARALGVSLHIEIRA